MFMPNRLNISKKVQETASKLLPIDDSMFEKMAESKEFCEELISTILGTPIVLKGFIPQKSIKNLENRSVRLDLACILQKDCDYGTAGSIIIVEVQKSDNDDHLRRVRYNSSLITAARTPKSVRFQDVPDVIAIFISKFDIFEGGYNFYIIDRIIRQTKQTSENDIRLRNGLTEIYVNSSVRDESNQHVKNITELMDIFSKAETYNYDKFPHTSERKNQFRNTEEGRRIMCEKVEQSYQEIEKYKLYEYVEEGGMDPEFAAKKTGQSAAEFKREMKKNGYKVPPASRRAKVMK